MNRQDARAAKKEKKRLRRLRREALRARKREYSKTKRGLRFAVGLIGIALDFVPMGDTARRATRAALGGVKTARRRHSGRVMKHRKGE